MRRLRFCGFRLGASAGRARAYLGYLNREVLRPVTLSVHVYSVRVEREADYDLGLSFSIARLLGEALRVSVGANAVALIKPSRRWALLVGAGRSGHHGTRRAPLRASLVRPPGNRNRQVRAKKRGLQTGPFRSPASRYRRWLHP